MTVMRLATLDLPEGNAMRAPGEAPGMMALEIAMDEMAEKLGLDPIEFRVRNDTASRSGDPERPFSATPARRVHARRRRALRLEQAQSEARPGARRPLAGRHRHGGGVPQQPAHCQRRAVRLDSRGVVTVETDMTDIGTGSYTIIAQTAAEMMGVPLDKVVVRARRFGFPVSSGSGGQFGANNSTSGVYAACVKLREAIARKFGFNSADSSLSMARCVRAIAAFRWPTRLGTKVFRSRTGLNTATLPRSISNRPSAHISSR